MTPRPLRHRRPGLAAALLALVACDEPTPPPPPGELVFVRGGVMSPTDKVDGQPLPGGGALVLRDWRPGEQVSVAGLTATAPARAECQALYSIDLGDVSRLIAAGGAPPDTSLAFSPGPGDRLAVGSDRGEVLVLDGWSGRVLARRRLAETRVKQVAWSPDGRTLYAAEQSPDAYLHALDPGSLEPRWSLRLADIVETSTPPGGEDIYGVYSLPAAYGLEVLPSGDLVVAALHGWTDGEGVRRNRSQVLRVTPGGEIAARWPAEPGDATIQHPAVDAEGGLVAVVVDRSADGPAPADLPVGGVQVLSLPDLAPVRAVRAEPLAPHFSSARVWQALDVSRARDAVLTGFSDGRVRVVDLDGEQRLLLDNGAPVMAGEVPVVASVGWGFLFGDGLVWATSQSQIPFGAASPSLRPPMSHPAENTLWHAGLDGTVRWSWTGPQRIEGIRLGDDGRHLVAGAGARETDTRADLFGALVFDLGEPARPDARSGEERLLAFCPTRGPVSFQLAMSRDGRVAVAEHPYMGADGMVKGAYQVTVLR